MKTEFKLPKGLDWVKISATNGILEFDCPKCMHSNSINISVFDTETHRNQDSEELQLTDQKFGYADKFSVVLANIIAFAVTVLILFSFFGELMGSEEYGNLTYLLGVPIMVVLAKMILPLFRRAFPIWLFKCKNCGEWIILSSNGEETHLARDTTAKKESRQATATSEQEQTKVKSPNEAAIWDLKNGDKKAKSNAALSLITSHDPNAVEIILEQALKEDPAPENQSFFSTSVKEDLLMTLTMNIKKLRTNNSVNAYINVLSSGDKKVINHAIIMLGNLGNPQAIQPLEKLIREGYSGLRPNAIEKTVMRIKKKNRMPIE